MSICLIVPGYPSAIDSMHPPLGLIMVRSMLKCCGSAAVTILDGITPTDVIVRQLAKNHQTVGIHVHALNVKQALWFGRTLRKLHIPVVFGGPEITISTSLQWADGAFDLAVQGQLTQSIAKDIMELSRPLDKSRVLRGSTRLDQEIDYSGLNLEKYWERSPKHDDTTRHAPVITHLGCSFRDLTRGGCRFCADVATPFRVRTENLLQKEIDNLHDLYGVTGFYCVGENLTNGLANRLISHISCPTDSRWSFFARANEIDEVTVHRMKKWGLSEIRLGAESGDPDLLAATAKGETVKGIEKAIQILNHADIRVIASFILGLPEETYSSLSRTRDLALSWAAKYHVVSLSASVAVPIPGSDMARMAGVLPGDGITLQTQEAYLNKFTSVTFSDIESIGSEIGGESRTIPAASSMVNAPLQPRAKRDAYPTVSELAV